MNIMTILKPSPHCPIPFGHPCHRGYTPADETQVRRTWSRHKVADDYDLTDHATVRNDPSTWLANGGDA